MQMRAAVLEDLGQPPAVQEVEPADPEAGEVLVRLVACGVCHLLAEAQDGIRSVIES